MKKIDLVEIASREVDVKNLEYRLQQPSPSATPSFWPESTIAVGGTGVPLFAKFEVASED